MPSRWTMLAVLFAVRATIAFQFQSVAAVGPVSGPELGIGIAELGVLIGLYFAPGVVLAVPGGALGARLGDKRTVAAGVALMAVGACLMALAPSWTGQVAGRLVAGAGGVFLNIVLAKMVADWFAGREIATAMAIFINSWPAGVALSLMVLPVVATAYGVGSAHLVVAGATAAVGLVALTVYRAPARVASGAPQAARMSRAAAAAVLAAGAIWALYNVGFAMVFSFGPAMLVERGWPVSAAGSTTSIVLWLAVVSVPVGGILADRSGRPAAVLVIGCAVFGALLLAAARGAPAVPTYVALGLLCGLAAGPIMSLPARVLEGPTRPRDGAVLRRVLCRDDARAGPRGLLCRLRGNRGRRLGFRRGAPARLPGAASRVPRERRPCVPAAILGGDLAGARGLRAFERERGEAVHPCLSPSRFGPPSATRH